VGIAIARNHLRFGACGREHVGVMTEPFPHPLLDLPLVRAARLAEIEDRAAALLHCSSDTVVFGAEAVLPLEAVTASLGGPGRKWLNVVTSGYGRVFGALLRARGSTVHDLIAPNDRPIRADQVAAELERFPGVNALAVVHAESLTGIVNPLPEIIALAREHGALTVVDAVASAGAEPLEIDSMGIDVCVVGPQKGWGGPVGVSVVTVSERAWESMRTNPSTARQSVLSLLDIKQRWLAPGRSRVIGTPPPLEIAALEAAIDRLEGEGIGAVVARHQRTAAAVRAAVRALGLSTWAAQETDACAVATPLRAPDGVAVDALVALVSECYGIDLTPGLGDLAGLTVRIDHMGSQASFAYAAAAIAALGAGLRDLGAEVDVQAGAVAVAAAVGV
jgi:aspartate aminotransferase-like enzyme